MTNGYSVEIERKVYDDDEGVSICICPDPDLPENIILLTTEHDEKSKRFYGDIRLHIAKDHAMLLGQALIDQAKEK